MDQKYLVVFEMKYLVSEMFQFINRGITDIFISQGEETVNTSFYK